MTTEDSTNFDIGLHREAGLLQFEVNLFYYDIEDYVHQRTSDAFRDGLQIAEYAQGDAEFFGFEAAMTFSVVNSAQLNAEMRVFSDYVNAELTNGDNLPRIPPWRIGINLEADRANLKTGLDVIYHADQDDISSFNTKNYTAVNLNLNYKLDGEYGNWEFFARGTNLLDETARKSTSFLAAFAPLPGRSLHMGLRMKF